MKDILGKRRSRSWVSSKASKRISKALGKVVQEESKPVGQKSEVFVDEKVVPDQAKTTWRGAHWTTFQRALYLRQLATLYESGHPLERSMLHLAGSAEGQALYERLKEMGMSVQRGISFPRAVDNSKLFAAVQVGILEAGESSGRLGESLNWLARAEQAENEYRSALKSRLTYPVFVLLFAWLGSAVFVAVLAAVVKTVVESLPTGAFQFRGFLALLLHPLAPWVFFVAPPILVLVAWKARKVFWQAKLPGRFRFLVETPKQIWVGRVLAQLIETGFPITQSLSLAGKVGYPEEFQRALAALEQGKPLHESLPSVLPRLFLGMAAVGEEVGATAKLMFCACDLLEVSWTSAMDSIMAVVEPVLLVLIVVLACAVVVPLLEPLSSFLDFI